LDFLEVIWIEFCLSSLIKSNINEISI